MKKSKKLPFLNIADEQGNVLFGDSLGDLLKKGHGTTIDARDGDDTVYGTRSRWTAGTAAETTGSSVVRVSIPCLAMRWTWWDVLEAATTALMPVLVMMRFSVTHERCPIRRGAAM